MTLTSPKAFHLLPLVVLGLVLGISGGWIRLGSTLIPIASAGMNHGLLMVGCFLGTLISIERAMVLKKKIWLVIPFLTGLSSLFFLTGMIQIGLLLLLVGSLGLGIIMHLQSVRHPHFHTFLLYAGAMFWFIGNFMTWRSGLIAAGTTWWMGFLLFTIVGERLELSQFLPVPPWTKKALVIHLLLVFIGLLVPFHTWGNEILGLGILLIAVWLLVFDIAKVIAKKTEQFRYLGVGLSTGYLWLGGQGIILFALESHPLFYDLILHTFFLGFTFSMIWAHAPSIFPTIFGIRETPYHPILWVTWTLFQVSLAGRVLFSLMESYELRKAFGVANGYLILIQFGIMAGIVIWKIRNRKPIGNLNHIRKEKNSPILDSRV
ncbi:hypothetical protein [Algoriphagus persicinus]|uniref:hypothetical protein n=1 Tax=Algoriphagus persicinus TaxID=3108754 RepID=UPI002B3F5877|nr:hypothetical protein [Algoriphagus sp. E1-3-M2]MEB2785334.1 hypothetical protein [Algoriphagus sp. E1-3-M2]